MARTFCILFLRLRTSNDFFENFKLPRPLNTKISGHPVQRRFCARSSPFLLLYTLLRILLSIGQRNGEHRSVLFLSPVYPATRGRRSTANNAALTARAKVEEEPEWSKCRRRRKSETCSFVRSQEEVRDRRTSIGSSCRAETFPGTFTAGGRGCDHLMRPSPKWLHTFSKLLSRSRATSSSRFRTRNHDTFSLSTSLLCFFFDNYFSTGRRSTMEKSQTDCLALSACCQNTSDSEQISLRPRSSWINYEKCQSTGTNFEIHRQKFTFPAPFNRLRWLTGSRTITSDPTRVQ